MAALPLEEAEVPETTLEVSDASPEVSGVGEPQAAALTAISADIPTAVILLNRTHNPFQNFKAVFINPLISDIVLGQDFVPGQYFD